jgi:hypothetical protein
MMVRLIFKNSDGIWLCVGFASVGYISNDTTEITMDVAVSQLVKLIGENWQMTYSNKIALQGNIPKNTTRESLLVEGLTISLL